MKKVIITGATGFIGKNLVKNLIEKKIDVFIIVREVQKKLNFFTNLPVKVIYCDLSNLNQLPSLIKEWDIDAVFHLAWQGVSDDDAKSSDIQINNIKFTLDLIEAMHIMKIKTFVGCGSMHELESIIEMNEDKIVSNLGYMYKAAKIATHWMGKAKSGNYGIKFFWPYINTYGEGETSKRLINTMIQNIFNDLSPALSSGCQIYDFVHVADVCEALYLIAEKGINGKSYYIGSGTAKPLKEFLTIVSDITNNIKGGDSIPLNFGKITDNVISLPLETFDISDLMQDTGYYPKISFEEGILRTASWIKNEQNTIHDEKEN